jgi:hypothetical protein
MIDGEKMQIQVRRRQRTARDAWFRASALLCCVSRADLEEDARENAQRDRHRLDSWIEHIGLSQHMTDLETLICSSSPGSLADAIHTKAGWKEEGAGAIAWALGVRDHQPPYSEQVLLREQEIFEGLRFLDARAQPDAYTFRQGFDANQCADFYEVLTSWLRKSANGVRTEHLSGSSMAAAKCAAQSLIFINGALALGTVPLGQTSTRDREIALSIAAERYRAFGWLAGRLDNYDERPLEIAP